MYENLDWLAEQQEVVEDRMWRSREGGSPLFLYDVTSSYLEGTQNELAAFGYSRDGKRGKPQIVIGLLCDAEGDALSIEVFEGNTPDARTFASQIRKVAARFGGGPVTFVGDRGMIRGPQIEELGQAGLHYITAITKPQIEALLRQGTIQMDLFDQGLAEICGEAERYVLRRNPVRAAEIAACREDKLSALRRRLEDRNAYLARHPRARLSVALRDLRARAQQLGIADWVALDVEEQTRRLRLRVDEATRDEAARLDGCYVLKTDLPRGALDKETVHARYKDLALVEQAFRAMKTTALEMRPVHVRLAAHTRGHAFVVMLAYRILRELARRWAHLDLRPQEALNELAALCSTEILENGCPLCCQIPQPRPPVRRLLQAARVRLPEALPCGGAIVATKKTLPERRKKR